METLCLICGQDYKDPKVLPCLHSFCFQCICGFFDEESSPSSQFFCPACKHKVKVTKDDVNDLPEHFAATNLQPILRLHSTTSKESQVGQGNDLECGFCQRDQKGRGKAAVSRCNDCSLFICDYCADKHERVPALHSHSVLSLDAIKMSDPCCLAKTLFCRSHKNEPLKLFCEDCEFPICRDCSVLGHKYHQYHCINDVIEKEKIDIAQSITEANRKVPSLESNLQDIKNMKIRVKEKAFVLEKEVDTFIDKQVNILKELRQEWKTGVIAVIKTKMQALQTQENRVSQHLENIGTAVQFARQAMKNCSDTEILLVKKQISTRFADLSGMTFEPNPWQDDGIHFRVNNEKSVRDLMESIAWIDSNAAMPTLCSLHFNGGEPNIMYNTYCKQACDFVITLRDHFGQQLRYGNSCVHSAITWCPQEQQDIWGTNMKFLEITDNDDGTYNVSFVPLYPGKHAISVSVDKRHIKGSPYCWNVCQEMESYDNPLDIQQISSQKELDQESYASLNGIMADSCISWRVKYHGNHRSMSSASRAVNENSSSASLQSSTASTSHSTSSVCKIGVSKVPTKGQSSETTVATSCEDSPSPDSTPDSTPNQETSSSLQEDTWFWCNGFRFTPGDPSGTPSNIKSFEDGDTFVLFLDPLKRTLKIYNIESEESDCFEDIEFPVYPRFKG